MSDTVNYVEEYDCGCVSSPVPMEKLRGYCKKHGAIYTTVYRNNRESLPGRWNLAMADLCPGSEFVNEPERCAEHIRRCLELAAETTKAKQAKKPATTPHPYGLRQWLCACGAANLEVRQRCRVCRKQIDGQIDPLVLPDFVHQSCTQPTEGTEKNDHID